MTVAAKICGINSATAAEAAVAGGAAFTGFIFYPPSPRNVTPAEAAVLARAIPASVRRVGVVVDPSDADLDALLGDVPLDILQLHGDEAPERVDAVRARTGLAVMKAIRVGGAADLEALDAYEDAADWLLFDAKPPTGRRGALPGGNARAFDWELLHGRSWRRPWMLSGGLNPENVAEAVRVTGAAVVDVSSGVEDSPGVKSPARILAFLGATRSA